jgi:hypothetical protein
MRKQGVALLAALQTVFTGQPLYACLGLNRPTGPIDVELLDENAGRPGRVLWHSWWALICTKQSCANVATQEIAAGKSYVWTLHADLGKGVTAGVTLVIETPYVVTALARWQENLSCAAPLAINADHEPTLYEISVQAPVVLR